jgi:hypothetical protein
MRSECANGAQKMMGNKGDATQATMMQEDVTSKGQSGNNNWFGRSTG